MRKIMPVVSFHDCDYNRQRIILHFLWLSIKTDHEMELKEYHFADLCREISAM
jgi:hypothetical protein